MPILFKAQQTHIKVSYTVSMDLDETNPNYLLKVNKLET